MEGASKELVKEGYDLLVKAWDSFDDCSRESEEEMDIFISELDARWRMAEALGMKNLTDEVRTLMLLK